MEEVGLPPGLGQRKGREKVQGKEHRAQRSWDGWRWGPSHKSFETFCSYSGSLGVSDVGKEVVMKAERGQGCIGSGHRV